MENDRFDTFARTLARATNRRSAIKGMLGIGMAAIGATRLAPGTDAARRGYSGPPILAPRPEPEACDCPSNQLCVDGMCFYPCIGCGCSCTHASSAGWVCTLQVYGTSGSCEGKCEEGYACNGSNICMQPCPI